MYEVEKRPNEFFIKDTEGNYVAEVFYMPDDVDREREAKERALLFAAAPELLEALNELINGEHEHLWDYCEWLGDKSGKAEATEAAANRADAAIKKAKGE